MIRPVGIVLGRLSPPVPGRLQAFPWATWRDEFDRARASGFDALEWIFERDRYAENPLWTDDGLAAMGAAARASGVPVTSVCADYFMARPFFRVPPDERAESIRIGEQLIRRCGRAGIRTVLLPVLEHSEIRSTEDRDALLGALASLLAVAGEAGVTVGLEAELPAPEYRALVEDAGHPALGVYYDVGNATARGYDAARDVRVLAPYLCGVHVKDRRRGGPSVPLGEGDVDFAAFFAALTGAGYGGPIVLQPATGADYLGAARAHLAFVRACWAAAAAPGR